MKLPKLLNGPTPVGESFVNALENVNAPYLTLWGGGAMTKKKNGAYQVSQEAIAASNPWLFLAANAGAGRAVRADPSVPTSTKVGAFSTPLDSEQFTGGLYRFVGDNYLITCNYAVSDTDYVYWPALVLANKSAVEHTSTDGAVGRLATSFRDEVSAALVKHDVDSSYSASTRNVVSDSFYSTVAFGWQDETERYRFGVAYPGKVTPSYTNEHHVFVGATGDRSLTEVAFPNTSGAQHYVSQAFVTGPGGATMLMHVNDNPTGGGGAHEDPTKFSFVTSSDHGGSWSAASTNLFDDLVAYYATYPNLWGPDLSNQRVTLAMRSTIIYMGDNKTLLVIPNGLVDTYDSVGSSSTTTYLVCAPMLFRGDGGTYTRQEWPCDRWTSGWAGGGNATDGFVGLFGTRIGGLGTAHFALGGGAAYIPVFQGGAVRAMVTKDYGATWSFTPPVPPEFVNQDASFRDYFFAGAVVRPYVNEEDQGQTVFAAPDAAGGKINFFASNDCLQTFVPFGRAASVSGLTLSGNSCMNHWLVNFGGRNRKPSIYPAFPTEFDAP
jgi:hypothetical protein